MIEPDPDREPADAHPDARACGVRTVAAGPGQNGATVRALLTAPWSNAQVEDQLIRLKMLKRTLHGCAGFDLRRRALLAA